MKKVLELLYDEGTGRFSIDSDFNPVEGINPNCRKDLKRYEKITDKLVSLIIDRNQKGTDISAIIRLLSISGICADAQPYDNIEELWSAMMFSFLPEKEKEYRKIKEAKGIKVKVHEPLQMTPGLSCMEIPKPWPMKS